MCVCVCVCVRALLVGEIEEKSTASATYHVVCVETGGWVNSCCGVQGEEVRSGSAAAVAEELGSPLPRSASEGAEDRPVLALNENERPFPVFQLCH